MENAIAQRLKAFRISLGLTQGEFGDKCDISQRTYANLENGKTKKVSSDYLTQIEAAYKQLNPTWLRHGAGEMLRQQPMPSNFEEAAPPRPAMSISSPTPSLDEMSPTELASYWRVRAEEAEAKLAAIEEAARHERAVRLSSSAGGRSFTLASPEAADTDYTPPVMVAESNPDYVEKAAEADRLRIAGFVIGGR
jgi:transcriptional regulator with XRE-family HTH domain